MKQSIAQFIMANKANLSAGKAATIPVSWDDVVPDQQKIVTKSYKVDNTGDGIYNLPSTRKLHQEAVAKFEYITTAESFPEVYTDAAYDECQAFIRSIKEPEEIPSLEEILNKEFIRFNSEIETSETSEYSEVNVSSAE